MSNFSDFEDRLTRLNAAVENLRADIKALKDAVVPGMTQEEVDKVKADFDAALANAETLAGEQ